MVYRGCAIPVAWRIMRANQPGSWMDPIVELLQALAPAVPKEMTVVVLCDRGLASPKLWRQIMAQGWHPYMRYPKSITFCAEGGRRLPARAFVSRPDTAWIGRGTAFGAPAAKRRCTLLAVWYAEQQEPWIILTDLPPEAVGVSWYALRFWIELGFKAVKSLGWQWDKPAGPTRRVSLGIGSCCRWRRCWPWPMAPGWKTPTPGGLRPAICAHRPRPWLLRTLTLGVGRDGPSA